MKKLLITSWTLLFIALVFILMHYPGNSLILILGTTLLLTHGVIFTIRNWKNNLSKSFFHLALSTWTLYIAFRLLFWPCGPNLFGFSLLFLVACFVNLIWLRTFVKTNQRIKLPQIILGLYFILSISISFIHADEIYYYLNIKEIEKVGSELKLYDCVVWDKYSWFLYNAGKYEEAVLANLEAQKAAMALNQKSMLVAINYHKTLIKTKKWYDFNMK